jgi:2-amino-4-hydroxy-6-hydroxymethyldihydropteridine diphosphokinase
MTSRRTVLALGSNLGDRLATLQGGVGALLGPPGLALVALSPVYETVPVGGPPQPEYLNAVLIADTSLPAADLLRLGQAAEAAFGRVRQEVWGPRTLDVDVIVYGDVVSDDPELTLAPWLDADPDAEIPGRGPVAALLDAVVAANGGQPGVRRLAGTQLRAPA